VVDDINLAHQLAAQSVANIINELFEINIAHAAINVVERGKDGEVTICAVESN
jgi:hypothetical protein